MVPLQEIGGQYRQSWMDACIEKADHWVMIARKGDVSTEQIRALEQHGKLAGRVKPASRGCLEKGWWKIGERKSVVPVDELQETSVPGELMSGCGERVSE